MNKIVKDYINGRLAAIDKFKGTLEKGQIKALKSMFTKLEPAMEDIKTEEELQEAKKEIKNCILEKMEVQEIDDEKKRALTIQLIYNLADYHYEDVNSPEAIKEFSEDMGMTLNEYLAFAFKLAIEMALNEDKKEEKGPSLKLSDLFRF